MRYSQKAKPTLAMRMWVMTTLVVWIAALVFCSAECFFGNSQCQPSHHEEQASASHDDHDDDQAAAAHQHHDQAPDSDQHGDCPKTICDSLKNFVHAMDNSFIFKTDFSLAYLSGSASLSQALTVPQSEPLVFRQAWRRDWVFTPEVSLGPGIRSHAPPVLL